MALDTPATIAILGAGPIGLEAALYARYLGYEVQVYERGRVAENIRRWGHVRMFSPFGRNRSTLALAALAAQDPGFRPPGDDEQLTGEQFVERFLLPLSRTDLLDGNIFERREVLCVRRAPGAPSEATGDSTAEEEPRDHAPLLVVVRDAAGREEVCEADIVIDACGSYGNPNPLGPGGRPVDGQHEAADAIDFHMPDILGAERGHYAKRHILLVGAGCSAATAAVALAQLAAEAPGTQVTWITRRASATDPHAPILTVPNDPLPERARLVAEANALAAGRSPAVRHFGTTQIERIDRLAASLEVRLAGDPPRSVRVDRILALVGYRGEHRITAELGVRRPAVPDEAAAHGELEDRHEPWPDSSPAAAVVDRDGAAALLTPEPNFYVLGSKRLDGAAGFLIASGLRQIRNLFGLIGGRASLDLYKDVQPLI